MLFFFFFLTFNLKSDYYKVLKQYIHFIDLQIHDQSQQYVCETMTYESLFM
jgi:hypothetical protein